MLRAVLITVLFGCCSFKYVALPPTDGLVIERPARVEVELHGDYKGVVFEVERDSIRDEIEAELDALFPNRGDDLAVKVDVTIVYRWKIVPHFLGWPFFLFGAPMGTHVGIASVVLTTADGQRFEAEGREERLQGLYYGWAYDPPVKGGVMRYALRQALDGVRAQLACGVRGSTSAGCATPCRCPADRSDYCPSTRACRPL